MSAEAALVWEGTAAVGASDKGTVDGVKLIAVKPLQGAA